MLRSYLSTISALFFVLLLQNIANAAVSPWVAGPYSKAQLAVGGEQDEKYYAAVEIAAEPGWKMYWRTPGDAGFPPTFDWSGSTNVKQFDVRWPAPKRETDTYEGGQLESYVYKDRLFLPIILHLNQPDAPYTIKLKLDYGTCKDICIPASAEFTLDVAAHHKDAEQITRIKSMLAKTPQANGKAAISIKNLRWMEDSGKQYIAMRAEAKQPFEHPDLFIETQGMFKFTSPEIHYVDTTHATLRSEVIPLTAEPAALQGNTLHITLADNHAAVEKQFVAKELAKKTLAEPSPTSFAAILWLAFLGGLILNVMPCVLPVLSIKLLTILQKGGAELNSVRQGFLASAAGIMVSFFALAVITIGLKETGQAVGWGFHFQNPVFLITLVVILVLFASSLVGRFNINLPVGLNDFLMHKTPMRHQTVLGDFVAGIFATILATPCTAPFLGTAVSFALSRGVVDILVIFLFMGFGLASPYLVFAVFPRWVTRLPRPGAWMGAVKYIMAALLVLTAMWLLWVLSHDLGTRAAVVVFLAVLLIKFFAEMNARFLIRLLGIAVTLAALFTTPMIIARQDEKAHALVEEVWEVFDEAAIPPLVEGGKVVFVDVTADWCLTCKFNKMLVLNRPDMMQRFKALGVVAMRADITKPNPKILAYLEAHKRYGIPFNIVYGPGAKDGIVLSELLSSKEVNQALEQAAQK